MEPVQRRLVVQMLHPRRRRRHRLQVLEEAEKRGTRAGIDARVGVARAARGEAAAVMRARTVLACATRGASDPRGPRCTVVGGVVHGVCGPGTRSRNSAATSCIPLQSARRRRRRGGARRRRASATAGWRRRYPIHRRRQSPAPSSRPAPAAAPAPHGAPPAASRRRRPSACRVPRARAVGRSAPRRGRGATDGSRRSGR